MPPDTRGRLASELFFLQKHGGTGVFHEKRTDFVMFSTTGMLVGWPAPVSFHKIRPRGPVQKM